MTRKVRDRFRRGQTMVLFALMIFVVALMTLMTLGISTRIKERIETQTVADTAAYSNAIATARTMNGLALMNRAQIGHMVAEAGIASLISWTSLYKVLFDDELLSFTLLRGRYAACAGGGFNAACCTKLGIVISFLTDIRLSAEFFRIRAVWPIAEPAASVGMVTRWGAAELLYLDEMSFYRSGLRGDKLDSQALAGRIASAAAPAGSRWPGEFSAPSSGDVVTTDEIGGGLQCIGGGAICDMNFLNMHMVDAATGSMGWPFVVRRWDPLRILERKLDQNVRAIIPGGPFPPEIPPLPYPIWPLRISGPTANLGATGIDGGTYWNFAPHPGLVPVNSWALISDEHAFQTNFEVQNDLLPIPTGCWAPLGAGVLAPFICAFPPFISCPDKTEWIPMTTTLLIGSNPLINPGTAIHWTYGGLGLGPVDLGVGFHWASIPMILSGMWPNQVDYNFFTAMVRGNNYGQPKNIAVIQRNYAMRSFDPWQVKFDLGNSQAYDAQGKFLADGTNISKQTAASTGIAYYHRRGHWSEPPNLMNPYWRATLVAADTDGNSSDAQRVINSVGYNSAADALNSLWGAGFRGMH